MNIEEFVNYYLQNYRHEVLLNPYNGLIEFAKVFQEKMMEEEVKWLVDDDYHEASERGRFILGSVGIGYNGYYIPYSDLLKLPKEDEK